MIEASKITKLKFKECNMQQNHNSTKVKFLNCEKIKTLKRNIRKS